MEIQIKRVKISNKGVPEIGYVEIWEDGKSPEVTHFGKAVAHDDLINALKELAPHYALITGYAHFTKGLRLETLKAGVDNFKVSGYTIGGKEENQGIVITGHVIVAFSGKACIVNSPFTMFDEGDETKYKFIDALAEVVEKISDESKLYIVDRKFKPEAQQELPFGEENSGTVITEGGELKQSEETKE